MYFWGADKRYWADSEIRRVLTVVRGDDVIVYPGPDFPRWIRCAENVRGQLRK